MDSRHTAGFCTGSSGEALVGGLPRRGFPSCGLRVDFQSLRPWEIAAVTLTLLNSVIAGHCPSMGATERDCSR